MATEQKFVIKKGRTGNIEVVVSGITDWTGLVAKLFASDQIQEGTILLELDGNITPAENKINFPYGYDETNDLMEGTLYFEVILFKADKTIIDDSVYGLLEIMSSVKIDPTAE